MYSLCILCHIMLPMIIQSYDRLYELDRKVLVVLLSQLLSSVRSREGRYRSLVGIAIRSSRRICSTSCFDSVLTKAFIKSKDRYVFCHSTGIIRARARTSVRRQSQKGPNMYEELRSLRVRRLFVRMRL